MSCFNYISPQAAERFFSDEAKNEKLGWYPPQLLTSGRQRKRMENLARSDKESDRLVAAASPSTPKGWLVWLSADDSVLVRSAVAKNPNMTVNLLFDWLEEEEDAGIRAYLKFRIDNER